MMLLRLSLVFLPPTTVARALRTHTGDRPEPHDIRKKCTDEGGNCYVEMDYLDDYLNLDYVKEAVGASNIDIFTSCDDTVFRNLIPLWRRDETVPPICCRIVGEGRACSFV